MGFFDSLFNFGKSKTRKHKGTKRSRKNKNKTRHRKNKRRSYRGG